MFGFGDYRIRDCQGWTRRSFLRFGAGLPFAAGMLGGRRWRRRPSAEGPVGDADLAGRRAEPSGSVRSEAERTGGISRTVRGDPHADAGMQFTELLAAAGGAQRSVFGRADEHQLQRRASAGRFHRLDVRQGQRRR